MMPKKKNQDEKKKKAKSKKSKKSKGIKSKKSSKIKENLKSKTSNKEFDPKIEKILKDHINSVNSKWQSNVFPSSSLAKIVLKELNIPKTRFRIIHKEVRNILMNWAEKKLCVHIGTTHYTHSSKTKMIYEFPDEMIDFFRFEGMFSLPI